MKKVILLSGFCFFLIACDALLGKEIARLPINAITKDSTNIIIKEASVELKKADVISIWSDMDMEYEGGAELRFRIDVLLNNNLIGGLEINPMEKNVTVGELKTEFGNKTNWSFTGKNKEITIESDGNYTFKAILVAADNPTLLLKKAELVIKK